MVIHESSLTSRVTSKGQATIPKQVREHLGVKSGDRVKFFMLSDGRAVILPTLPASAARGIVKPLGRPVTLEEMDAAIEAGATARFRRFESQTENSSSTPKSGTRPPKPTERRRKHAARES